MLVVTKLSFISIVLGLFLFFKQNHLTPFFIRNSEIQVNYLSLKL